MLLFKNPLKHFTSHIAHEIIVKINRMGSVMNRESPWRLITKRLLLKKIRLMARSEFVFRYSFSLENCSAAPSDPLKKLPENCGL
ncbi:Uncharacterised protein [Mycobacteroides abscessus subsp. abscessus]|nr:Uncharacterised protein [Mycobacteroides abscessus subsp. abscessus]